MRISPVSVLAQLLINEGIFSLPSLGGSWPLYRNHLPEGSNVGCIYNTTGVKDGRLMSGENPEHPGIQLRIRSDDYETGWKKIQDAKTYLDDILREEITISNAIYFIQSVSCSPVNTIGIEPDTKRNWMFTLNATCCIRETVL